jgi:cellulose synthase/poly-beta-1,6-N-acetylglucosamine synthase-like glycosyltransferase
MEVLFWSCIGFIAYTYAGYPLLVALFSRFRPALQKPAEIDSASLPSVSVCIAMYNEETRVNLKLDNLRSLDYPKDKLEIVIASDGSTDRTDDTVEANHDVVLVKCAHRGKAATLNSAVAAASGEILLMTDARQQLSPNAADQLVRRVLEPGIGVAGGFLVHRGADAGQGEGVGLYWRYERWIRVAESRLYSTIGASGALYAIRRRDYTPLRAGTLLDDFDAPIRVLRKGLRIVLDESAQAIDTTESQPGAERARKTRTLAGNFQSFVRQPWLFLPIANPIWWQFISHKVMRLLVPYALLGALVGAILGRGAIYQAAAAAQLFFYAIALAALTSERARVNRLVNLVGTFVELNAAAVLGLFMFVSGRAGSTWVSRPKISR